LYISRKAAPALRPQGTRPRLAIVSTYDELCGIAGYTRALEAQLRPHMDVTVFNLDQYLLRSPHRRVQKLGDAHIADIAAQLRDFDSVNIQLEHGTLGRMPRPILRRFARLAKAAPALSVTFHTVLSDNPLPWEEIWRHLRRGAISAAGATISDNIRAGLLSRGLYGLLRRMQHRKPVQAILHTKRDMRLLRDVYRLRHVHHHPLSFVDAPRAQAIRAAATREPLPALRNIPDGAKLIGSFGFLSPYKGFETAIRALRHLPDDHHLLIFGGIHPQTIRRNQPLDPYIAELLREGRIGASLLEELGEAGAAASVQAAAAELLGRHPLDLGGRIHFMGVLDDADFLSAMALCDAVVLPYLEVGQSSSGPIAMALEMGCRVIASRTAAFLQYARYHPGLIEFFDIGNHVELAQRIAAPPAAPPQDRRLAYNTETNAALYLAANARHLADA
jgi:glycosyltransferase involved in cell wall biosynthesis